MCLSTCTRNAATVAALLCLFLGLSAGNYMRPSIRRLGSINGQEEIGPIDNYTCTNNGAFPHEECDLFITCWNGEAVLHRCTEIMLFDLRYNGCNWAEYVDCEDRHRPPTYPGTTTPKTTSTTPDPTATTRLTTPKPNGAFNCPSNGVFPHAEKCEYYWSCYDDVAQLIHCDLDYLFDLKYNGCNFPELTDCGERERPPTLPPTSTAAPTESTTLATESSQQPTTPTTTESSSGSTEPGSTPTSISTGGPSSTTGGPGDDFECPSPDGLFADPNDCGAYFSCDASIPTRKLCPDGLHFSPEKQICDWPDAAGCEI